ncbi:MAG TPA: hypothetical protein VNA88_12285 [Candidatus Kapabacteria bacterium]|jgi:hypothetical protein|nr:hypothetical protein [Candidatus Kapabacteria bacterium]
MRISDLVGTVVGIAHREFPGRIISCQVIGVDPELRAIALVRRDLDENDDRNAQRFWTTLENVSEIRFGDEVKE